MKKKLLISTIIFITLSAALIVAYFITEHKLLYHFAVVDEGKVYRSGTLSELGLKWAKSKSGFKTIINLRTEQENREPWYKEEEAFAEKNNIKLVNIPMQTATPPTQEQIKQFLKIVETPENLPVLIHCHQGVTRTAMIVAIYEMAVKGKDNKLVYETVEKFGRTFEKPDKKKVKNFILTFKKKKQE